MDKNKSVPKTSDTKKTIEGQSNQILTNPRNMEFACCGATEMQRRRCDKI